MIIKKESDDYKKGFLLYIEIIKSLNLVKINNSNLRLEIQYESLTDWSQIHSFQFVKNWFLKKRKNPSIKVKNIPLNHCRNWEMKKGNYVHKSGEFFKVTALRVSETKSREVDEWDQPILTQKHGGILAILMREKKSGIIEFLLCARREPGDAKLKLCPSFSATRSNINLAHGGKKTLLSNLIFNHKKSNLIAKTIHYEEGARFWRKNNQNLLIKIDKKDQLKINKF
mgnify:CR=1 FL=1